MIDLNNVKYEHNSEKIKLTILQNHSEEDIFRHYAGVFKIGKPFSSPFRNDNHSSFSIFIGKDTGAILYHEMLYKEVGNCFTFVKKLYDLPSYKHTYLKICVDLGITNIEELNDANIEKIKHIKKNTSRPSNLKIGIKYRKFSIVDKTFWSQFCISKNTLSGT